MAPGARWTMCGFVTQHRKPSIATPTIGPGQGSIASSIGWAIEGCRTSGTLATTFDHDPPTPANISTVIGVVPRGSATAWSMSVWTTAARPPAAVWSPTKRPSPTQTCRMTRSGKKVLSRVAPAQNPPAVSMGS